MSLVCHIEPKCVAIPEKADTKDMSHVSTVPPEKAGHVVHVCGNSVTCFTANTPGKLRAGKGVWTIPCGLIRFESLLGCLGHQLVVSIRTHSHSDRPEGPCGLL